MFPGADIPQVLKIAQYHIVGNGEVLNFVSKAVNLTRGKLIKGIDWDEWKQFKYKQLNQYNEQGMSGEPKMTTKDSSVFMLIWTVRIRASNSHEF